MNSEEYFSKCNIRSLIKHAERAWHLHVIIIHLRFQ